jgi:ABC-2 type transport system ATP-binding protein
MGEPRVATRDGKIGALVPAIQVRGLVKRYAEVEAVRGIDLDVAPGETFGFLGPNGAGKSTTIKILCTLVEASSGTARVAGWDVVTERDAVRRHIGLVFQEPTLDTYLTGEQNLRFHGELYGVDRSSAAARREEVLRMFGLWERRSDEVNTYSGGMRRRLEIARGLLHSPKVLFLDEPTIGLDPQTRASIWKYLRELHRSEETTVFVTTHYMDEAENCDRIAIINEGQIVALDTPERLKAAVGKDPGYRSPPRTTAPRSARCTSTSTSMRQCTRDWSPSRSARARPSCPGCSPGLAWPSSR